MIIKSIRTNWTRPVAWIRKHTQTVGKFQATWLDFGRKYYMGSGLTWFKSRCPTNGCTDRQKRSLWLLYKWHNWTTHHRHGPFLIWSSLTGPVLRHYRHSVPGAPSTVGVLAAHSQPTINFAAAYQLRRHTRDTHTQWQHNVLRAVNTAGGE